MFESLEFDRPVNWSNDKKIEKEHMVLSSPLLDCSNYDVIDTVIKTNEKGQCGVNSDVPTYHISLRYLAAYKPETPRKAKNISPVAGLLTLLIPRLSFSVNPRLMTLIVFQKTRRTSIDIWTSVWVQSRPPSTSFHEANILPALTCHIKCHPTGNRTTSCLVLSEKITWICICFLLDTILNASTKHDISISAMGVTKKVFFLCWIVLAQTKVFLV